MPFVQSVSPRMRSQKQRLQDRVDQDPVLGANLAATVRRSSGNATPSCTHASVVPDRSQQPPFSTTDTHEKKETVETVGDVVERRRRKISRRRFPPVDTIDSKLSDNVNNMSTPVNGFPSLQQRHIGTFLPSTNVVNASSRKSSTTTSKVMLESPTCKNASLSILEQSSMDSQALLEQMSIDEIRESVQELHKVLKADIIRFLRRRGNCTKVKSFEEPKRLHVPLRLEPPLVVTLNKPDVPLELDPNESLTATCSMTIKKNLKEELATAMSSIQTYEDLDAAYDHYFKNETSGETNDSLLSSIKDEYTDDEKFQVACKLLRSSSPQQTLWAARVVCIRLKYELERNPRSYSLTPSIYSECEITRQKANRWPFPVLLPVSLRCVLDSQSTQSLCGSGGVLLTTYVLQSLLLLLQLRACSDHIFCNPAEQKKDFYQVDFLDDVVPSVPLRFCYFDAIAEPVNAPASCGVEGGNLSTGVYWTSSSTSTSAISDGQAFVSDPMWTLLSRMRIIPRLAEILQLFRNGAVLPIEARTSICGILVMIGQRSSGASSAIIHHPTLIDDLLEKMIVHRDNSAQYDSRSAIPFIYLLCTLARQSRVVAEGIRRRIATDNSPIILHLLAPYSETSDNTASCDVSLDLPDFTLQQWTFILWRTLLRYGLCLDILPTILTLSARHLTLGAIRATESMSVAPELYSCFAIMLHDASMNAKMLNILDSKSVNTSSIFRMVSVPWQRQSIYHLQKLIDSDNFCCNGEVIRLASGIFRFWGALLGYATNFFATNGPMYDIMDGVVADLKLLFPVLDAIMCHSRMASMVSQALYFAHNPDFSDAIVDLVSLNAGTRAAAFLESFVVLLSRIRDFAVRISDSLPFEAKNLESKLAGLLLSEIVRMHMAKNVYLCSQGEQPIEAMQRYRFNRVQAIIVSFLCSSDFGYNVSGLKTMTFAVIGRLGVGEEFTASVLCRLPELFRHSTMTSKSFDSSLISEVLCRELILTQANQIQFDHSCNLNNDWNVFMNSKGSSLLQSLLVDTGHVTNPVYFLPVGKYWLWKLLSGSSINPEASSQDPERDETVNVLDEVLMIIDELESDQSFYCVNLNSGPKLYYLVNVFLNGKAVLSQDRVVSLIEKLFNLYFTGLEPRDLLRFVEECRIHSKPNHGGNEGKKSSSTGENDFEAILNPQERDVFGFSTNHLRCLETLVGDLCDAYLDFGFHFPMFTKCVRLFLVHGFPTKVRCSIVHRLRGDLHLLTIRNEESIATILTRFVSGGLPSLDQSIRDDPILIDCVASIYAKGSMCRPDDLFVKSWTICILVRSLAISVVTRNSSSLFVSKRRILSLELAMATQVVLVTAVWLSKDGSVSSLVSSVLLNDAQLREELSDELRSTNVDVMDWENVVGILSAVSRINDYVSDTSK
jgi:hypothetical protein